MIRSLILYSIFLIISGCGGGPEYPEYCEDQETFIGPQNEECYLDSRSSIPQTPTREQSI